MAQKPITMEQLKQIRQLNHDGIGIREIARRTGISRNSVRKYLSLLKKEEADSNEELTNKELADKAYGTGLADLNAERLQQLISYLKETEHELSKTGVTRQLLWKEYLQRHPDGYAYSHYCYHLKDYLKHKDVSMHLEYNPADMIMVDFAGKKLHYVDVSTGECIECQVFIAILPFSGLIFCCAVHSQQTSDFTSCINAMLRFYAGVPATILCDNLKTAVNRPSRYEPVFTDLCYQLSEHYSTTFSATRPYSPRDKAMVEKAVNIVYNHVYGPLRKQEFTSLQALNTAIQDWLILLNNKPYKNTAFSRWYFLNKRNIPFLNHCPRNLLPLRK